jgi:C-terminal processing protease CtpA/Prc
VWAGSPADRQNLIVGDKIIKINTRKASELSQSELVDLLANDSVKTLELVIVSAGVERQVLFDKEYFLS